MKNGESGDMLTASQRDSDMSASSNSDNSTSFFEPSLLGVSQSPIRTNYNSVSGNSDNQNTPLKLNKKFSKEYINPTLVKNNFE